jgi:hypothetical protein
MSNLTYDHVKMAAPYERGVNHKEALCGPIPGGVYHTARGVQDFPAIRADCNKYGSWPLCPKCDKIMKEMEQ